MCCLEFRVNLYPVFIARYRVFFLEVMRSRTERPEGNRKSLITVVTRALEIIMGRKRRKKKIEDRIIHNPTSLSRTFDNKILENKHKLAIFHQIYSASVFKTTPAATTENGTNPS